MSVFVHVINGSYGRPVVGMSARMDRLIDGTWVEQLRDRTDDRGELASLLDRPLARSIYQVEFDLDEYFSGLGITPFHPSVPIRFRIVDPNHENHISLLITPSSYMTYRLDRQEQRGIFDDWR